MKISRCVVSLLILLMPLSMLAQGVVDKDVLEDMKVEVSTKDTLIDYEVVPYKKVGTKQFVVRVYTPDEERFSGVRPAVVIIHGGGWGGGSPDTFIPHARYFRDRGMKVFVATYRLANEKTKLPPSECLVDTKSAIRFVRANASKFNIDPNRIVASGGSAGAHLSAAAALIDGFNDEGDDLSISAIPNALVLFSPVIDNGPGGFGYDRVKEYYKDFSPLHNIRQGMPPTVSFLGTKDSLIPVVTMQYFHEMIERVGSRSELYIYEGQAHGFFKSEKYFPETMGKAMVFLEEVGIVE
ncbi:MAG: alpha/beta hydrolase [Rikenellaceae bacterium]